MAIYISCTNDKTDLEKQNVQEDKSNSEMAINFEKIPTISGADTIIFNNKIEYLSGPNKKSEIGNWFQFNSNLKYLVEQKKYKDLFVHELQIYDSKGNLLAKKLLTDTSFVLKSPQKRTSIAHRKSNWIYIETGIKEGDSIIVLKTEKFEILSLLGSEYDSKFINVK